MTNWNNGYSATYLATIVDPQSWLDLETFEMTGGSISHVFTGLRESADLEGITIDPQQEMWVRIYLFSRQGGEQTRTAMFTGVASSPDWEYEGTRKVIPLACYSVLKPCEDVLLDRGWYAPNGADGANLVRQLLSQTTPAPVIVEGVSPTLSQHIIAEDKENHLSMSDKILDAINWRLRILGDGTIVICPPATEVQIAFDAVNNDSIEPHLSLKHDWYSCPNVFRAVQGDSYAIARDDDPDSRFSTKTRGREVWAEETNCNLNSGDSLGSYARRKLKQAQQSMIEIEYTRRYNPNLLVSDWVNLNYPAQKISGNYMVVSQSIDLTFGGKTSEKVEAVWEN